MPGRNRHRAFLGLGGNIGDPRDAMASALSAVDEDTQTVIVRVSSLYRTPPWGKTDQPDFLNAVAEVETSRSPRALLDLCLAVEAALHRVRAERWGPRSIDMDILLFDDMTLDEEGLQVPHPRMLDRAFVMLPLAEIAPTVMIAGRSASDHLKHLDTSAIEPVASGDWWR